VGCYFVIQINNNLIITGCYMILCYVIRVQLVSVLYTDAECMPVLKVDQTSNFNFVLSSSAYFKDYCLTEKSSYRPEVVQEQILSCAL